MLSSMASRTAFKVASQAPRLTCRPALGRNLAVQSGMSKNAFNNTRQFSSRIPSFQPQGSFMQRNKKELIMGGIGLAGLTYLCTRGATQQGVGTSTTQWPSYVQQRLKSSYAYVMGGLGVTAGSAVLLFRNGAAFVVMRANPWVFMIGSLVGTIGGLMFTMATPPEDKLVKHLAWGSVMTMFGLTLSPMCLLGGPLLMRAAMMTGTTVGALSLVAYNTPNDTFLGLGGPLAVGLGVLIGSSLAGMLIPAYASMAYNVSLYGGLGLFGLFVLYDTQKMVEKAKVLAKYDPINESLGLYLDTINIFIRMASILSNNRRK